MSLTKFDNITRSALWSAYNHKCFYCNQALDWDDLHIDHIIPESIAETKEVLENIISDFGLNVELHINIFYNLVPSHVKCNLRKSNELFPKATILYYFGLTQKKTEKVEEEIAKLKNKKIKGNLFQN